MKMVRLAIFLTGIMGLAMGGVTAISSLKTNQEELLLKTHENLKSEATQFVDQFFGVLENTKTFSTANGTIAAPNYITHRAVLKLKDGLPSEFESFSTVDNANTNPTAQVDYALEERVLTALKADLAMGDLTIMKVGLGTYKMNDMSSREGIYVATPVYQNANGVLNPALIEKVNITLIDPTKAFSSLQKVAGADQSAYLMNKKGRVLAHTLPAYVGTDLKRVEGLKDTIENLFLGAQTGSVLKYTNAEGSKEVLALVRVGASPFAIAVEQKASPAVLSGAWISEEISSGAARKNFGVALMMIAIALVSFSLISIFASREMQKQIELGVSSRQETNAAMTPPIHFGASKIAPSLYTPRIHPTSEAPLPSRVEKATEDFVEIRSQLNETLNSSKAANQSIQIKRDDVEGFIQRIQKSYTLEGIEQELVQISAELSDSPTLYFRYHRRNQTLSLSSIAGEVKIPNYTDMQAYVRKDIELQVEQLAEQGKVASVTHYGPMNKLIISQLNVAHFEAWSVTSSADISGQARMIGVLIILQAGTKSAQARPAIAKVLRESGNYLYAITNKVKPRSSVYANKDTATTDTFNL